MFLPRWVQIIGGAFLMLVSMLCLWGSLAMLSLPPTTSPAFFYGIDFLLFFGSCWVFAKGVRLIAGRPVQGGLMGYTSLHVSAWLFLLMPVGALLAGTFWDGPVIVRTLQAVSYVGIFFMLRSLAKERQTPENE